MHQGEAKYHRTIKKTPSTSYELESSIVVRPKQIRPFPRAPGKKPSGRGRKPGRCMNDTDTSEKQKL